MPDRTTAHRTSGTKAALAALGIVYGDLGTSPLYTYQAIVGAAGGHPSAADALGLLSLVVWTLIVTISVKYCVFVMRADNHGEGGPLALMALVSSRMNRSGVVIIMGLFGAALIYGDGIITPAISVLSALEGSTSSPTRSSPTCCLRPWQYCSGCSSSNRAAPQVSAAYLGRSCWSGSPPLQYSACSVSSANRSS